jgi:(p)ppGpp synthase/HD superfamily hydrolase
MTPVEIHAYLFASAAHAATGQTRKYTGEPYIKHPKAVVEILRTVPHTPEMLAAAWLHDVVEDTAVTLDQIEVFFGPEIATLVEMVTDVSKPDDGNRAVRKAIDREHIGRANATAQTIKLADLIDNTRSIIARDPEFAKVYLAEKRELLKVLTKGNEDLWVAAHFVAEGGKL